MISTYVNTDQKDWDQYLKPVLMAYRTSAHASTLQTPSMLLYGRELRLPVHIALLPPTEQSTSIQFHLEKVLKNVTEAQNKAKVQIEKSQQNSKDRYDKNVQEETYEIGNKVWLWNPTVQKGNVKKLSSLWHGPFTIIEKCGPVNYRLAVENRRIPSMVHHNRLKPYVDRTLPPTEEVDISDSTPIIAHKYMPAESNPPVVKPVIETTDTIQDNVYQAEKILKKGIKTTRLNIE